MNVLCHGYPFCCDATPLRRYKGKHEIRTLGVLPDADYGYDPATDDMCAVLRRIQLHWQPDLLLCWTPEMYPPPQRVEEASIPTVALVSDWNIYFPRLEYNLARYDLVLCDRAGENVLASPFVQPRFAMPLYSHISTIHRPLGLERDIDVLFLGNLNHAVHTRRARYLERLARMAPGLRIIIGEGFTLDDYAQLLNRARIVFNHSIRGELNLRVFESLACGALPLLESDNLEARGYFTDGEDLVFYNEDTFEDVIETVLRDDDTRERIAGRAHARSAEWAGENRFDALIGYCASWARQGARRFHALPAEEMPFHTWLQYAGARDRAWFPVERSLVETLAQTYPDDPRTAIAQAGVWVRSDGGRGEAARMTYEASRRDRTSAPYALNAATAFKAVGRPGMERRCLEACLQAHGTSGAALVGGSIESLFWTRWVRALAEKKAAVSMLHAEAVFRLGALAASQGESLHALDLLTQARTYDPMHRSGDALEAELRWAGGARDAAAATISAALEHHPFDRALRGRLSEMMRELGRHEAAQALAAETALMSARCISPRSAVDGA